MEPPIQALLFSPLFEEFHDVFVRAPAFGGVLHLQNNCVKKVRQMEDHLILLVVPLRTNFEQGAEQKPVDGFDG